MIYLLSYPPSFLDYKGFEGRGSILCVTQLCIPSTQHLVGSWNQ